MADTLAISVDPMRSRIMAAIKGKDTKPEMIVRRHLHAAGFRYSLHRKDLPGRPDLALRKHRAVVLVQGCFWHGHHCKTRMPSTRAAWWAAKIEATGNGTSAPRQPWWRSGGGSTRSGNATCGRPGPLRRWPPISCPGLRRDRSSAHG